MATLDGVMLVPPALVGAARAVLQQQGFNPNIVLPNGEIDTSELFAAGFNIIELRTNATPPLVFDISGPSSPEVRSLLSSLKPNIFLRGRAGRIEIAPYGRPTPPADFKTAGAHFGFAIGASLLGILLFGAALFGKKRG